MKIKSIAMSIFAISALISSATFADNSANAKAEFETMVKQYNGAVESALKSSDVHAGLVKACGIQYKKTVDTKMLTQAEVNKLCKCTVDAEGQMTNAQKWELQSAANSKNQTKAQQVQMNLVKQQGDSVKKCVGPALDQKLAKLAQQAQTNAARK